MIHDLWGHVAEGSRDDRSWLDHGRWPLAHPLSPRPGLPGGAVEPPEFATVDEPGAMQLPLGPIHGVIGEPAHLRLTVRGEQVLRAEARLGYAHKGTLALMRGKSPRTAARGSWPGWRPRRPSRTHWRLRPRHRGRRWPSRPRPAPSPCAC